MRTEPAPHSPAKDRNALLAGLPWNEWDRLSQDLHRVELAGQSVLHEGGPLRHAHFPLSGYVSLLLEMSDGFQTEIADIGAEGMLGLPLVLGHDACAMTAAVQIGGEALRIPAAAFTAHLGRMPTLQRRLLAFAGVNAARSAQLAACNAHHTLDTRVARCLLGLHDRARSPTLTVTHDVLAGLLCVHRPSVSVALGRLQRLGLIRHGSRFLVVADRDGLERASCECYAIMRGLRCSSEPAALAS